METANVGKVLVAARIENLYDLYDVDKGRIALDQARKIEVPDALVDTGAAGLHLPGRLIQELGLKPYRTRSLRTASGTVTIREFGTVRLTVQGRECTTDVAELPDDCPVLIGQVPLEMLDFVIDPKAQKLMGNPQHGGEQMLELWTYFDPPPCSP